MTILNVLLCSLLPLGVLSFPQLPLPSPDISVADEILKTYFGDFVPQTTRTYTLIGNALNGPADFNAALPVPVEYEGAVNSIIVHRSSPAVPPTAATGSVPIPAEGAWEPMVELAPYPPNPGGHRGHSDVPDEMIQDRVAQDNNDVKNEDETPIIITAPEESTPQFTDNGEISMESLMTFGAGLVD